MKALKPRESKYTKYLRPSKEQRASAVSGLPPLSVEHFLALPRSEFIAIAKKAGMRATVLFRSLRREQERQKIRTEIRNNAPEPFYEMNANKRRMLAAYEDINREFDFIARSYSLDEVDELLMKADKMYYAQKLEKTETVLKKKPDTIRQYRRAYVLEALARARKELNTKEVINDELVKAAKKFLQGRIPGANDEVQLAALWEALGIFEDYSKHTPEYVHWHELFRIYSKDQAYRKELLSYDNRMKLLSVFQQVRDRSRADLSPLNLWSSFKIENYISIIAANYLRLYDAYNPGSSGYTSKNDSTGAAEIYSTMGIGGVFGYATRGKGSRPHRDPSGGNGEPW